MAERPVADVPGWVLGALAIALAGQLAVSAVRPTPATAAADLPAPPAADALRLASVGEPMAAAKLAMLWLQAFDYRAGSRIPYRNLDYDRVAAWLDRIIDLDPDGQYPLMAASRLYAEVPDPERMRTMLDLVYRRYLEDPDRRWPWLAHAAYLAKHRLHDLPLARQYAVALQTRTTARNVPAWVRQMEFFILEDMNELETAKILLGGLLASGQITDERELALLRRRLEDLEARAANEGGRKTPDSSKNRQ